MSDYQTVKRELDRGTPPELLCATCPWDRLCITPPTMTAAEIDRQIKAAATESPMIPGDGAPKDGRLMAGLLTAMMVGGKDTAAQVCPVFAMRLAGPDGRQIADGIRSRMRDWQQAGADR